RKPPRNIIQCAASQTVKQNRLLWCREPAFPGISCLARSTKCWSLGLSAVVTYRPVVGSLRQSCLAQALSKADAVLRLPERRCYPVKIAKPQRGIDLAQAGHRRPRLDHPIRKSIGHRRRPQCRGPIRLLVEGLGRPGYRLVVTTGKGIREGHAG